MPGTDDIDWNLPPLSCVYGNLPDISRIHMHRRALRLLQDFSSFTGRQLKNKRRFGIGITDLHRLWFKRYSILHNKISCIAFLSPFYSRDRRPEQNVSAIYYSMHQLPCDTSLPEKLQSLIQSDPFRRIYLPGQDKILFLHHCPVSQHQHLLLIIGIAADIF